MGRSREEAIRINRPFGKKRIKTVLKKITQTMNERNREAAILLYLLGDWLQDGLIDGSLLLSLQGVLF